MSTLCWFQCYLVLYFKIINMNNNKHKESYHLIISFGLWWWIFEKVTNKLSSPTTHVKWIVIFDLIKLNIKFINILMKLI